MHEQQLKLNFEKYLTLEAELSKQIAQYLWEKYPFQNRSDIQYSEDCADNYWTVGLTPRGLYFEAYAWDAYSKIAKELGIDPGEYSFDPVFTQDIRFFERLPFDVLRYLYCAMQRS